MSPSKSLLALFGHESFSVVADSDEFLRECTCLGFNTAHVSELEILPRHSLVFSFSNEAARLTFDIAKKTESKKSIFCAAQVFDPSLSSALYSLKLLMSSDFEHALSTQRRVLNMLNSNDCFSLSGNDADACVTIFPHAKPYALLSEDVENDFIQSVAEFFEVHYAHMNPVEPCPFSFSGTLKVEGILTVLRKPNLSLPDGLKTSLKWLSVRISEGSTFLSVDNNIITSLTISGEEHIKLLDLAAGGRGLKLTEFAVGVNDDIAPSIDYKINSQLNEGVSGVHLAIGDGTSGYHIDFLSPGVSVIPMSQ
ncbi:hypothetical protein NYP20_11875 [Pseudomonas sp. N3-W]|uniref:hypothetical protein n=1 Tax=Pseudomonas sp. N3-W TaxID=2975049 RepID=UPI00217DDB3B|nr:hypothetical protein [Pseudomonas sp. N3-W]UWF51617.1 hypothetical protein NYP20_11875 [Pseudomonas sp. N3-W]